jgi:hypothetical protein
MQSPHEKFEMLQGCTNKINYNIPVMTNINEITKRDKESNILFIPKDEIKEIVITLKIIEMAWLMFRKSETCIKILHRILGENYPTREMNMNDEDREIVDAIYPFLEEIFVLFVENIPINDNETYVLIFQSFNGNKIRIEKTSPTKYGSPFIIADCETSNDNNYDKNSRIIISLFCTLDRYKLIIGNTYSDYNNIMICHKSGWLSAVEALQLQM